MLLCLSPILDDLAQGPFIEALLLTLVLVSAVPAVGGRRRTLLLAGLLAVPAVAGKWLHHLRPEQFPSAVFLTPASNAARMLALLEAMTAMFYIAILIARLVALYSERPASE